MVKKDGMILEKTAPEGGYILSLRARERLGERCGAFFNGKEGRDDFRNPFLNGKEAV